MARCEHDYTFEGCCRVQCFGCGEFLCRDCLANHRAASIQQHPWRSPWGVFGLCAAATTTATVAPAHPDPAILAWAAAPAPAILAPLGTMAATVAADYMMSRGARDTAIYLVSYYVWISKARVDDTLRL